MGMRKLILITITVIGLTGCAGQAKHQSLTSEEECAEAVVEYLRNTDLEIDTVYRIETGPETIVVKVKRTKLTDE